MKIQANQTQEKKDRSLAAAGSKMQSNGDSSPRFIGSRPEAVTQRKLQEMANNSEQVSRLRSVQLMANNSPQAQKAAQLQQMADSHPQLHKAAPLPAIPGNDLLQQQSVQKKENNTGLPDNLKSGIEDLSGYSLDDVKVNYNSDKPAQLQAHAYAQGSEIHIASGQEKHLPHEAWHVVQQKQGRVKPTMQMKGKLNINDNEGLEKEADIMGKKASQFADFRHEAAVQRKQYGMSDNSQIGAASAIVQFSLTGKEAETEMAKKLGNKKEAEDDDELDLFGESTPEEEEEARLASEERKRKLIEQQKKKEEEWRAKAMAGPDDEAIIALKNKYLGKTWDNLETDFQVAVKTRGDRKSQMEGFIATIKTGVSLEEVAELVFKIAQAHPLEDVNKRFAFACGVVASKGTMGNDDALRIVEESNSKLD